VKILGLDPGKTTGYMLIELDGQKITPTVHFGGEKNGEIMEEIVPLIREADLVIIEDFLVRPDKARKGSFDYSSMVAPQVIGKIIQACQMTATKYEKQPASVKPPAYGFSNQKYVPGKKGMHWQDAYAHAVYYAVKKLNALPVG
jgi:hypothetical protein